MEFEVGDVDVSDDVVKFHSLPPSGGQDRNNSVNPLGSPINEIKILSVSLKSHKTTYLRRMRQKIEF